MTEGVRLLVDVVLLLTIAEFMVLRYWHRRTGRGVDPDHIARNLISGLMLMLALRFALTDGGQWLVMLFLALAGLANALDILSRWRR